MRALVQRVRGSTMIESELADSAPRKSQFAGVGMVVLLGWLAADATEGEARLAERENWLVSRVTGLRIFPDAQGRMNLNLGDYLRSSGSSGGILWVPQFTLAAKLESGFRPSFTDALAPDLARQRFDALRARIGRETPNYAQIFCDFGADMTLSFSNWGPVTIPLET